MSQPNPTIYRTLDEKDVIQTADQYRIEEGPWIEVNDSIGKTAGEYPEREFRRTTEEGKYSPKLLEWHAPLWQDERTLREVYTELMKFGNNQDQVPWIVKLIENPFFHFGGLGYFKGRVTLQQHDYIHILLGRGTMLADEAFVIGFTMGSTDKVSEIERNLFSLIVNKLYPQEYKFSEIGKRIFQDALALAWASDCQALEEIDFEPMLDWSLKDIRKAIGLEPELLQAYYQVEANRYPKSRASQRLIPPARKPAPQQDNSQSLEELINQGYTLQKQGVKLFKCHKDESEADYPYKVDVNESIIKGIECNGCFSTFELAYECYKKKVHSLKNEIKSRYESVMAFDQ